MFRNEKKSFKHTQTNRKRYVIHFFSSFNSLKRELMIQRENMRCMLLEINLIIFSKKCL
jgi:hypothetical protein